MIFREDLFWSLSLPINHSLRFSSCNKPHTYQVFPIFQNLEACDLNFEMQNNLWFSARVEKEENSTTQIFLRVSFAPTRSNVTPLWEFSRSKLTLSLPSFRPPSNPSHETRPDRSESDQDQFAGNKILVLSLKF